MSEINSEQEAMQMLADPAKFITNLKAKIEAECKAKFNVAENATTATTEQVVADLPAPSETPSQKEKTAELEPAPTFKMEGEESDPGFIYNDEFTYVHDMIESTRKNEGLVITKITGPHGTGKTLSCRGYSHKFKLPILRIDCSVIRDTEKWFGERALFKSSTKFYPSAMVNAIEEGNCVIVLDEINRVPGIDILNPLLPLFDHSGKIHIAPMGRDVVIGPNIAVFATLNEGAQYTGITDDIDAALNSRMNYAIKTNYPTKEEEKTILKVKVPALKKKELETIIDISAASRNALKHFSGMATGNSWDVRTSINLGKSLVATKGDWNSAKYSVLNFFSNEGGIESENVLIAGVISGKVGNFDKPQKKAKKGSDPDNDEGVKM